MSGRSPVELLDLTGQVALVTGAGGNIGTAICQRFAQAGTTVVAHTRGSPPPDGFAHLTADLSDPDAPARLVAGVCERFGKLDVLVNNAGIFPVSPLAEISRAEWDDVIHINLTAAHRLTQAAAEVLPDGGAIVHVASIEGHQPNEGHAHYAAAKAGLIMHARSAAIELGRRGIRVNSVSPGLISRPGIEADWPEGVSRWLAVAPLGRLGEPVDVGDACVFLASSMAGFITGADLVVDGGVLARPTW